jgi:hypothetical protein
MLRGIERIEGEFLNTINGLMVWVSAFDDIGQACRRATVAVIKGSHEIGR